MSANQKKLLIVEDDGILRQVLAEFFGKEYEVETAEDGEKAIELALSTKPALILLDLLLPKKDGFAVLAAVRKSNEPAVSQTPVVILSNLYTNADILRAENLKISAYFVKAHTELKEVDKKIKEILG